ncbi:MAG: UDP-N-acetylmuramoyl-tripeptide--D-alanyl-D-alanine ligase [Phycisphaerae bacterium]|nr:UDP-N-acetylmuramoyl-tripeptide--D-alanyl-D-alanine ligase [Phycisphaerae bacterium]MDW8262194.1 UDP-N-acetylmuramoyl-tripeptide--D-alanyl-D-alanine ligase [Phycisphaerales bacterium]
MDPIPLDRIRQLTGARSARSLPPGLLVHAINTDTRRVVPGALFVAIPGERFDGHDFVPACPQSGAVAALVQRPLSDTPPDLPLLQVESTRRAIGTLAQDVRLRFGGRVIAVAGSNGKTSTKHLIHDVLSTRLRGSMSPKSFNNDIGVPLTIFQADARDDFLVLELGTNHPGEIAALTHIGAPDIAVITNCAEEHLEFLGDLATVRRENFSIVQGLQPGGLLIINGDDPELLALAGSFDGRKITFGFSGGNDLVAAEVQAAEDGVRFRVNGDREFQVPLLGRHSAANALAAIAVARELGLSDTDIADGLARTRGPEMRLQLREVGGVRMLNDAYNANPASMRAALATIATMKPESRRVAVLGDMRELGAMSEKYHREIGRAAAEAGVELLACVGSQAHLLARAAEEHGLDRRNIRCFEDAAAASRVIPSWLRKGDLVLLKASRGVRLELVAEGIEAAWKHRTRQMASASS